jgi:hypothetical protein
MCLNRSFFLSLPALGFPRNANKIVVCTYCPVVFVAGDRKKVHHHHICQHHITMISCAGGSVASNGGKQPSRGGEVGRVLGLPSLLQLLPW